MKFVSTRSQVHHGGLALNFSEALEMGLAPDGGLYVPESFPAFRAEDFEGLNTLPEIGAKLLAPFFEGDALAGQVPEICRAAFDFPVTLKVLNDRLSVLELFHGPTAAFKDIGARFLAECLSRSPVKAERSVLVATSGDTGGAVAAAFHRKHGFRVVVLFPKGRVSERQEKQLTCWGDNVHALAVRGDFDDCQRIVKSALASAEWKARHPVSANSINIGRLLPQMSYYAWASLECWRNRGTRADFIIPSGNLGNSVAALWARRVGLPIGRIVLATNANGAVGEFFKTGEWKPFPTVQTLANAMDVGNPSNAERMIHLGTEPGTETTAVSVSDEEIRQTIKEGPGQWGEVWCPHTATAVFAHGKQPAGHWIIVSTAHPAKFESIVEPLIGRRIEVPPALETLMGRTSHHVEIGPDFRELSVWQDTLSKCFPPGYT